MTWIKLNVMTIQEKNQVTRIEGTNYGWRKSIKKYQLFTETFGQGGFIWKPIPHKRFKTLEALLKKAYER